jgi:hypothetical protein
VAARQPCVEELAGAAVVDARRPGAVVVERDPARVADGQASWIRVDVDARQRDLRVRCPVEQVQLLAGVVEDDVAPVQRDAVGEHGEVGGHRRRRLDLRAELRLVQAEDAVLVDVGDDRALGERRSGQD